MIEVADDVAQALSDGHPVVALDSLLLAHGLPRPRNRVLAEEAEDRLRAAGCTPATIGMIDGVVRVGVDAEGLARLADGGDDMPALSWRDLPPALSFGGDGALTPGAAATVGRSVGIRTLATPGVVGVAEDGTGPADLEALCTAGVTVVCAGALPPAEAGATMRRCATLAVTMIGLGVTTFPGCLRAPTQLSLDWVVEEAEEVARVAAVRDLLGAHMSSLLVLTTLPEAAAVPGRLHDRLERAGLSAAERNGVGDRLLPAYLTGFLHASSQQRSLNAHAAVLEAVVDAAASVATASVATASHSARPQSAAGASEPRNVSAQQA